MIIKDLTGVSHNLKLGNVNIHSQRSVRSDLHVKARELLKEIYPTVQILEEIPIPVRKSETLYFDFFIPLLSLCVEVHGSQHYVFNQFFHKSQADFLKQKKNDRDKEEFCRINSFELVILPYNKTPDEWRQILKA